MLPENIKNIGDNDILLVGYPGSAAKWYGSIFILLDFFYVMGYHERLLDRSSHKTVLTSNNTHLRYRLNAVTEKDKRRNFKYPEPLRMLTTHCKVERFARVYPSVLKNNKVILIVRDFRDCLISAHGWRKAFAGLKISFEDYIGSNSDDDSIRYGCAPAQSWAQFNERWVAVVPPENLFVLSFEECQRAPFDVIGRVLSFIGVERDDEAVKKAIEMSTFEKMRKFEESSMAEKGESSDDRLMRRGQVGEWKEIYSEDMLSLVSGYPESVMDRLNKIVEAQRGMSSRLKT